MEHILTPVILVDHKFWALSNHFVVVTTAHDLIFNLKMKVKEKRPYKLSRFNISYLTMWKTKGEKIINLSTLDNLKNILEGIEIHDKDTIQMFGDEVKVMDLGLSYGQILLIQLGSTSHFLTTIGCFLIQVIGVVTEDISVGNPVMNVVDPEYFLRFLKAHARVFTEDDVKLNGISDTSEVNVPSFVNRYEELLNRKRTVA